MNSGAAGAEGASGEVVLKGEEGADCPNQELPKPEVADCGKLRLLPPTGDAGWLDPNEKAVLDVDAPNEKGEAPNVAGLLGAEPVCPNGLVDALLGGPNANVLVLGPNGNDPLLGDCTVPAASGALF